MKTNLVTNYFQITIIDRNVVSLFSGQVQFFAVTLVSVVIMNGKIILRLDVFLYMPLIVCFPTK